MRGLWLQGNCAAGERPPAVPPKDAQQRASLLAPAGATSCGKLLPINEEPKPSSRTPQLVGWIFPETLGLCFEGFVLTALGAGSDFAFPLRLPFSWLTLEGKQTFNFQQLSGDFNH